MIDTFPLDKDSWYQERDDRTNRAEETRKYSNYHVGVVVDSEIENSFPLQCMTLLSCNILARWCRKITIEMPDCKSIIHTDENDNLKTVIEELISKIDPYGKFIFDEVCESEVNSILVIGSTEKKLQDPFIWIAASGWIAGCGYGNSVGMLADKKNSNPVGPSFAACMGTAAIFSRSVNHNHEHFQKWFSLYDFDNTLTNPETLQNPEFCNDYDFGIIHQIGCGAVGSSLDFLISLTNWKGEFFLIDSDKIAYSNCNRSLPFTAYDAKDHKNKVDVCSNILKNSARKVHPINNSYHEFTGMEEFSCSPDLVLSLANAENVWSTIQNNFPPMVLHATTTRNWGINFGRHIPKKEWCIMCRFSDYMKETFRPQCETGVIDTNSDTEILGVLPFLSPAAAILILAEMTKIQSRNFPITENFVNMSLQPQFGSVSLQKIAKNGCMCNEQSLDLFRYLRQNSKFWKYTE